MLFMFLIQFKTPPPSKVKKGSNNPRVLPIPSINAPSQIPPTKLYLLWYLDPIRMLSIEIIVGSGHALASHPFRAMSFS